MGDILIIDTATNTLRKTEKEYTIAEYKVQGKWPFDYISGKGLVSVVEQHAKMLNRKLTGLEIGICKGENIVHFLENLHEYVEKIHCIDPYLPYMDWIGPVTQDVVNEHKRIAIENFIPWSDKITMNIATSDEMVAKYPDDTFDWLFIDGDHSYQATKNDIVNYYSKVKSGGIFSGHDFNLPEVSRAVIEFCQQIRIREIKTTDVNVWYWIKP